MKKGFMALLCAVLLSVSAFADFIWDPLSFGYNNIFPPWLGLKKKGKCP